MLEGAQRECMVQIGRQSAAIIDTFNAQECSKLLFAFGKSGVSSPELERAASAQRDLAFEFGTGAVVLKGILGGARFDERGSARGTKTKQREGTKATAGTGGALWEDAYVLAEWLSRQRTSPLTGEPLPTTNLLPCTPLKNMAAAYLNTQARH